MSIVNMLRTERRFGVQITVRNVQTDSWSGRDVESAPPPSSAGVENGWSCTSAVPVCLHVVDMANL